MSPTGHVWGLVVGGCFVSESCQCTLLMFGFSLFFPDQIREELLILIIRRYIDRADRVD